MEYYADTDQIKAYALGEELNYPCGCIAIKTQAGFDHFVKPGCPFDDKQHAPIKGYTYKPMSALSDYRKYYNMLWNLRDIMPAR